MNSYVQCIDNMYDINDLQTSTFKIRNYVNWFYNAAYIYVDVPNIRKIYANLYESLTAYVFNKYKITI